MVIYSILQHDVGNLSKTNDNNAQKLVRVYFPDQSTTVIQIGEHESCWDVLCKVCEKKSLKPGLFMISMVSHEMLTHTNKRHSNVSKPAIDKTNIMDVEKNFFSYNCNTIYLIESGEEEDLRSRSSSRRSSTMVAPSSRKTTVRLDSQTFPKTIEVAEPQENDNYSLSSEKSKSDFSLKRGSKMFGFFLKGHKKNGSDSSSMLCASPCQSANISRQQSGINDCENNELSNFMKNSTLTITENVPLADDLFKQISNNLEKNSKHDHDILKKSLSDLGSGLLKESKDDITTDGMKEGENDESAQTMNFTPEIDPLIDNLKSYIVPVSAGAEKTSGNTKGPEEEEDGVAELPPSTTTSKPRGR